MPGNKSFYDQVSFLTSRYTSLCPDCKKYIRPGEKVVHLSYDRITLHWNCFYNGPAINWDPAQPTAKTCIDFNPGLWTEFKILIYRLQKKAGKLYE